jgi:hypothetical protein
MMKTTLNLDDQLLRKAKETAASRGMTLTRFVEDALREKLLEAPSKEPYTFEPVVVTGTSPPNVDITDRDALYEVIDRQ